MNQTITIKPNPGPQADFLACNADIAIFGGSGGGGKSFAALLEPLAHIDMKDFGAVIFRRTYPEIKNEGGMWDESCKIYPLLEAQPNLTDLVWRFPSGATVSFAHMQTDNDRFSYQGSQIPLIIFDELTHFTEAQFWYMLSRNRSTCGIKPYVRATTNPDADSWVRPLIDWWIGPDGYAIKERSGVIRWMVKSDRNIRWFDEHEQATQYANENGLSAKSFTFIRSSLYDNPILMQLDPGYEANLNSLGIVDKERLLRGNWNIRYTAGTLFKREQFGIVDAVPPLVRTVRYWDRAATEGGGDYTVGAKIGHDSKGNYYILDIVRGQWAPVGVERAIRNTAATDGRSVDIYLEQEPGSSGVADVQYLIRQLAGFTARAVRKTGNKLDCAKPLSAQVAIGMVKLLRGAWNNDFLNECESFDGMGNSHDDQVDAASGAFTQLPRASASVGTL